MDDDEIKVDINQIREIAELIEWRLDEVDSIILPLIKNYDRSLKEYGEDEDNEEDVVNFKQYLTKFEDYIDELNKEWFIEDTKFYQRTKKMIEILRQMINYYDKRGTIYETGISKIKGVVDDQEERINKKKKRFLRNPDYEAGLLDNLSFLIKDIKSGKRKLDPIELKKHVHGAFIMQLGRRNYPADLIDEFKTRIDSKFQKAGLPKIYTDEKQEVIGNPLDISNIEDINK